MTDRSRRRPWLAVLLALVVSGLGHAYLRRWARAFGWYVAVTATLVLVVPDAAVDRLVAGGPPPIADIAPAVLVVAASVIDAYVLAVRNNREYERDRRTNAGTPAERADPGASAGRADSGASAGRTDTGASADRADSGASAGRTDSGASAGRAEPGAPTDRPDRSTADDGIDAGAATCPHCGRETDPTFDFCQWCADPVDE